MGVQHWKLRAFTSSMIGLIALSVGYITIPLGIAAGDMTFRGTLIAPPPCKVDDSKTIEVYFGDKLGVNKINGVDYAKPLMYSLDCNDTSSHSWKLLLTLSGTPASFDPMVFKTQSLGSNKVNENNLGIRIYQEDGTVFKPNSQIEIRNAQNPPKLMAVPVKRAGSTLIEGGFETLLTLQAHYQ